MFFKSLCTHRRKPRPKCTILSQFWLHGPKQPRHMKELCGIRYRCLRRCVYWNSIMIINLFATLTKRKHIQRKWNIDKKISLLPILTKKKMQFMYSGFVKPKKLRYIYMNKFIFKHFLQKCYLDYRRTLHSIKSERFEGVYWKHWWKIFYTSFLLVWRNP